MSNNDLIAETSIIRSARPVTGRTRGRSQAAASGGGGEEVPGSPTKMLRQLQHPEDIRCLVTPALLQSIVPIPPVQSSISISIIQQIIVESFYFAFHKNAL